MSPHSELESAVADVIFLGNERKVPLSGLASLTRATPDQAKRALDELKKLGYLLRYPEQAWWNAYRFGSLVHSNSRQI